MSAISVPMPVRWGALGKAVFAKPKWLAAGAAVLLAIALLAGTAIVRARGAVQYVTQPVVRQTLVDSVTASGTVNPQNTINVGTQSSGTISQIYVDYNSVVKKGQILARIDPTTFQAQLNQAQAGLAQAQAQASAASFNASGASSGITVAAANSMSAKAAIASAQAGVVKAQSALQLSNVTVQRDDTLLKQGYIAQNAVDADRATAAQNDSALAVAQAAVAQAQATYDAQSAQVGASGSTAASSAATAQAAQAAVASAEATVAQDRYSLAHTIITSPVNGTVVARDISVGQTVAASLQTPTLFSIAQDLRKMEVDINVGEPDIGNVKTGDAVNFSVLAYPNQTFDGKVEQVRINPQTINNVVTYDVVVDVDNASGKLLPGMTANATVDVASAPNALIVPAAALQWKPYGGQGATAQSPWGSVNGAAASPAITAGATGTVFVKNGAGRPQAVPVQVTLSTAAFAAVVPAAPATLNVGDAIVVGSTGGHAHAAAAGAARSPLSGGSPMGGAGGSYRGATH
ncbi:MAG: efflux RND transporter periplasmic adaptor subunit [Vulcanimicrobiaceae bacterium]